MPPGASQYEVGNVGPNAIVQQGENFSIGLDEEKMVDALAAKGLLQPAETAGLQRRVIINLARRLKGDVIDFVQAVVELESAVEVALEVIARGERSTNADEFVAKVLSEIAEKTKREDFDGGARAVDDALAELDRREVKQRDEARHARVALLEAGVRQDTLRRDAVAVAARIAALVTVQQPAGRPAWLPEFRKDYDTYYKEGEAKGINFSLSVAIELARAMLATAHDGAERRTAATFLGNALLRLGERESGTARLEEAVMAYRAALEEWTHERAPLEWAMTQVNLGNALQALGERESRTARLEEAVTAYRAALEEWTHERAPLEWAMTQMNLGNALQALGRRESGTARLEEAVMAYRAALEEWTHERAPLQWAITQMNLGNALQALGERESGTARLEEAVTAYRAALEEITRAQVPFQWAGTQMNLGNALKALGERESGTARLKEAITAYRAALEEMTREWVPLDWAKSTGNQGVALILLAERLGDVTKARLGVQQIEVAFATMRDGGNAPAAAHYEAQLLKARSRANA